MPTTVIRAFETTADAEWAAATMAASEPWVTLGTGYERGLRLLDDLRRIGVRHRRREVHVQTPAPARGRCGKGPAEPGLVARVQAARARRWRLRRRREQREGRLGEVRPDLGPEAQRARVRELRPEGAAGARADWSLQPLIL